MWSRFDQLQIDPGRLKCFHACFLPRSSSRMRAIHVGFVSPRPAATATGPAWPFTLDSSWALTRLGVDDAAARMLGTALVAVTLGAFSLAAIASLGFLPTALWTVGAIVGALSSLALLGLFFQAWLVLGVAIDVAILWVVLIARWVPEWLAA